MWNPQANYQANVTLNPFGGTVNNSFKPPEGEIKIMFWNIQNLFEHGIMSKDEYDIEVKIGKNKTKVDAHGKPIKDLFPTSGPTVEVKPKNVKEHMTTTVQGNPTTHKGDKFGNKALRREWIARTINDSGADIVVIAELSIGTRDILNNLNNRQVAQSNLNQFSGTQGNFFSVDVGGGAWGPHQIMVDLNKLYDTKGNPWRAAVSAINAIGDFTCSLSKDKKRVEFKKGKNSMVEMYGLLWRSDRVSLGANPAIRIVSVDKSGALIKFRERAPGHIEIFSAQNETQKYFDLFCLHNLFGKETGSGAAERTRKNRGEGIDNLVKLGVFDLSKPTVVVGDFNLDMGSTLDAALYKPLQANMVQRISKQKSSYTPKSLVSEYDHIFTKELGPKHTDDTVINIADKYFNGSYASASLISDHMPVIAVLKSSLFPPPPGKGPTTDEVAVSNDKKMKRIKSEPPSQIVLQPVDSVFLAAIRGRNMAINNTQPKEMEQLGALKREAFELMMQAGKEWAIAKAVYQRIDDLYEDALRVEPLEELKHPDDWIFPTNSDQEYDNALAIAKWMWDEGLDLDQALEKAQVPVSDDYYDTISYLVMAAADDEANFNYQVNPNAKVPGVGPNLHQEFCKPFPQYDDCYVAYVKDLTIKDAIEASYVEVHAICEIFCVPVYVHRLDEFGNQQKDEHMPFNQMYSNGMGKPLNLLKIGSRYDLLFE